MPGGLFLSAEPAIADPSSHHRVAAAGERQKCLRITLKSSSPSGKKHGSGTKPFPRPSTWTLPRPKLYILDMFPYPSGAGLHVGHPEGYTATDILCRYKRMRGFNVLHPMGWDAYGLPAEQYAVQTNTHPRITTQANIDNFSPLRSVTPFLLRLGSAEIDIKPIPPTTVDAVDRPQDLRHLVIDPVSRMDRTVHEAALARARAGRSPNCRFRLTPRTPTPIATRGGSPIVPWSRSTGALPSGPSWPTKR